MAAPFVVCSPHPWHAFGVPSPSAEDSAAGRGESEWHEWWNSRRGGWWEAGSAALISRERGADWRHGRHAFWREPGRLALNLGGDGGKPGACHRPPTTPRSWWVDGREPLRFILKAQPLRFILKAPLPRPTFRAALAYRHQGARTERGWG